MGNVWNFILDLSQEEEYKLQYNYSVSLAKYIYNSGLGPIGNNTFNGRVNMSPESIIVSDYPALYLGFTVKK